MCEGKELHCTFIHMYQIIECQGHHKISLIGNFWIWGRQGHRFWTIMWHHLLMIISRLDKSNMTLCTTISLLSVFHISFLFFLLETFSSSYSQRSQFGYVPVIWIFSLHILLPFFTESVCQSNMFCFISLFCRKYWIKSLLC